MTDKNTILKNIQLTNNVYYIYLEQVKDSNLSCPNCGSLEITINFYYTRTIKYFNINDYPSIILFKQIRF
ncbi:MAG: hypothetical protein PUA56_04850 [Bacillales bacterium]|nr:hypothetical protein [Bacillales bacterium]